MGCKVIKLGSFSSSHVSFPFSTDLQAHVNPLCHTGSSTSALLTISLYYSQLTHKLFPFNFLPLCVMQGEQPCGMSVDGDSNFTPCSCRSPTLPSLGGSFIYLEVASANVTIFLYFSSQGKKKFIQLLLLKRYPLLANKNFNKKSVDALQMSLKAEYWVGIVELAGTGRQNLGQRSDLIAARIKYEWERWRHNPNRVCGQAKMQHFSERLEQGSGLCLQLLKCSYLFWVQKCSFWTVEMLSA